MRSLARLAAVLCLLACGDRLRAQAIAEPSLPIDRIAAENFGADAPWYIANIPFLESDDPAIQQIYYYRWKVFRSHIREIGEQGTIVTEFLGNVSWGRQPWTDLNDSTSFHILDGRWMRDPGVIDSLIDHEYSGGGNDRHFSESIAAATEARTRVTGDASIGIRHLDAMRYIYSAWDDHFDRARGLYWVEPVADATEYTISSIDASGAGFTDTPAKDQSHNGFNGGFAYRPSINSYQYGNALAIARFAKLAGEPGVAADYQRRAARVRAAVLDQLWNPALTHFTDRYQRTTRTVTAGEFIRGRELVGYLPWFYELPPKAAGAADYASAWKHLSADQLGGAQGIRTVEPSYPKYMAQYRYDAPTGLRECQWNGPSWPFQTSQTLTAMANLLDDYPAAGVTSADYLRLLRQYAAQHFLTPGHPDLQEDYDPDLGGPVVALPRSHHYSHSTFVDLVLSGLIGIRPRADEVLEVDPLMSAAGERPIRYFAVRGVAYHGHQVGVVYDVDGKRYGVGQGLSIFVDGRRAAGPVPLGRVQVQLTTLPPPPRKPIRVDLAVNVGVPDGPMASASSVGATGSAAEAIDGRMWFFPEIANGWTPATGEAESWYAVDLRETHTVGSVELYFLGDGDRYQAPTGFRIEYKLGSEWHEVPGQTRTPGIALANGVNRVTFPALAIRELRAKMMAPAKGELRLIELKAFAP